MSHQANLLNIIVIIFSTAVLVVAIFKKLKLSPVLGYFVAGGVIGEHGFKIVSSQQTEFFGEIGVVFLLFAIGLELTFERLKAMRVHVFGFGSLQVIISAVVIIGAILIFGLKLNAAIIIGGGLALSSTAIVLQVIEERREQSTQVGRLTLAILLMQDFAVVPLLVMVPILSGEHASPLMPILLAFMKAVITIIVIFLVGRICFRPLYRSITSSNSSSNELFIATTLLIALGTAWLTQTMGLSLALGAFAAGLLVAETEFQLQAEESIAPFKSLLLGLFFMSVGMAIDLQVIAEKILLISGFCLALIVTKATIIASLCLLFKFSLATGIYNGLLLSQGGEFAFILFRLAHQKGIIGDEHAQILLLVVTITMAITPLLASLGRYIFNKLESLDKASDIEKISQEVADLDNHVIIIGFGKVGRMVARLLEAENTNYIIIDIDPENVSQQKQEGFPIYLGDGSNLNMLKTISIERAKSLIITLDNKITIYKICKLLKTYFSNLPVIVRAHDLSNSKELYEAGAYIIVPETYEIGLQLGGAVLRSIGINELEIIRIKNRFRTGNYIYLPEVISEEKLNNKEDDDVKKNINYNI